MGNNKIIGAKIKSIRESKQLSTQEVSERSGLSIEQIERIEGNIDFPSLAPLIKIARVLGVRLGTFLDDQAELGPVICRKKDSNDTNSIGFSNNDSKARKHMEYHSLSQDKSGRHMEPFLIDVAPSEDGVDFVLSTHEGEEFIYVLEGVLEINYGKNTYILEEGDSIYYDSIVAHHVHAAADNTAQKSGFQAVLAGITMHTIGLIYSINKNQDCGPVSMQKIQEACVLMRENIYDKFTPEDIAESINMSYSNFRKSFKQYTGIAPHQYMLQLKLSKIKDLLSSTEMSIQDIAMKLNFESADYFSYFFRSKTGINPLSYRKEIEKQREKAKKNSH